MCINKSYFENFPEGLAKNMGRNLYVEIFISGWGNPLEEINSL